MKQKLAFPMLVITILSCFSSLLAEASVEVVPRSVLIAVENSARTRWCLHVANSFAARVIETVPLGSSVSLFEFASEVQPLGRTDNLQRNQVSVLVDRLPRCLSRERYVDYAKLANRLWWRADGPTAVIVVTTGRPYPPPDRSFVDPVSALNSAFPQSEGHVVVIAGVGDKCFGTASLPPHFCCFRLDTRTGRIPLLHESVFYARTRIHNLVPTPIWLTPTIPPTSTPTMTDPQRPTDTPTRTPTRTATAVPTTTKTFTTTPTSTMAPTPTKTETKPPVIAAAKLRPTNTSSPAPTSTSTPSPTTTPTISPTPTVTSTTQPFVTAFSSLQKEPGTRRLPPFITSKWLWVPFVPLVVVILGYLWLLRRKVQSETQASHRVLAKKSVGGQDTPAH